MGVVKHGFLVLVRRVFDRRKISSNAIAINEFTVGWNVKAIESEFPLTGFSHGNAGISLALMIASKHLGKSKYKELAIKALNFERDNYSKKDQNWKNFLSNKRPYSSFS